MTQVCLADMLSIGLLVQVAGLSRDLCACLRRYDRVQLVDAQMSTAISVGLLASFGAQHADLPGVNYYNISIVVSYPLWRVSLRPAFCQPLITLPMACS